METKIQTEVYTIEKNNKFNFIIVILLNEIINCKRIFTSNLTGDNIAIQEPLNYMLYNQLIQTEDNKYVATEKGTNLLHDFYNKFHEFLRLFDVFSAVDMNEGEFGFSKYFDFDTDEEFQEYIKQERFEDMRVAVCEFKKMDPIEIIFMSFLNEGRFESKDENNREITGWQKRLVEDKIWQEIIDICNSALHASEYMNNGIMENIITDGSKLMIDLFKKEEELKNQENNQEETITTTEETEYFEYPNYDCDYFMPYIDPFYVSPCWVMPMNIIY